MQLHIPRLNTLWVLETKQFLPLVQAHYAPRAVLLVGVQIVIDVRVNQLVVFLKLLQRFNLSKVFMFLVRDIPALAFSLFAM